MNMSILDVSTKRGYDIATALRGLDLVFARALKYVLAARIRWLVGTDSDWGWVREHPLSNNARWVTVGLKEELEQLLESDAYTGALRHYLMHTMEACHHLAFSAEEQCEEQDENERVRRRRHALVLENFARGLLRNSSDAGSLILTLVEEEARIEADYMDMREITDNLNDIDDSD